MTKGLEMKRIEKGWKCVEGYCCVAIIDDVCLEKIILRTFLTLDRISDPPLGLSINYVRTFT